MRRFPFTQLIVCLASYLLVPCSWAHTSHKQKRTPAIAWLCRNRISWIVAGTDVLGMLRTILPTCTNLVYVFAFVHNGVHDTAHVGGNHTLFIAVFRQLNFSRFGMVIAL